MSDLPQQVPALLPPFWALPEVEVIPGKVSFKPLVCSLCLAGGEVGVRLVVRGHAQNFTVVSIACHVFRPTQPMF